MSANHAHNTFGLFMATCGATFSLYLTIQILGNKWNTPEIVLRHGRVLYPYTNAIAFPIAFAATVVAMLVHLVDSGKLEGLRDKRPMLPMVIVTGMLFGGILTLIAVIDWLIIIADFWANLIPKSMAICVFDVLALIGSVLSLLVQCAFLRKEPEEQQEEA